MSRFDNLARKAHDCGLTLRYNTGSGRRYTLHFSVMLSEVPLQFATLDEVAAELDARINLGSVPYGPQARPSRRRSPPMRS